MRTPSARSAPESNERLVGEAQDHQRWDERNRHAGLMAETNDLEKTIRIRFGISLRIGLR
ncbi:MAG: hypothetical protein AB8F26_10535 [Phycisphaerales bacterium]